MTRRSATGDPGKQGRLAAGIPVVPAFDGYRALAVLAIVWLHVLIFSGVLPAAGGNWFFQLVQGTLGQAIDVLFIVSGFVVFLPTVARRGEFGSLGAYATRRVARLVPAYWLMLGVVLVVIALVPLVPQLALPGAGSIGVHAAFAQTPAQLIVSFPTGFGINGPLWTLSLEATYYLILPLVAGWYFRRPIAGLVIAGALTALWHEAIIHFDAVVAALGLELPPATSFRLQASALTQFPFFAFSFAAGMTGAWAYVRLRELHAPASLRRRVIPVQVASLVVLTLSAYLVGRDAVDGGVVLGAEVGRRSPLLALAFSGSLAALMVATALGPRRWRGPFANPAMRWLGDISYGIYLVHMVVVACALSALGLGTGDSLEGFVGTQGTLATGNGSLSSFVTLAAVVVPVSLLYGYLSARFLEQPIRRWARRYGRRRQRASA